MSVGSIFEFGGKILDRVIPDIDQRNAAKLRLLELEQQGKLTEEKNFQDFVVAYEGRGDQVSTTLQNYRGSVRPTITYFLIISFVYGFVQGFDLELMRMLWQLNLISLTFWFGERALSNLGLNITKVLSHQKPQQEKKTQD